MRRIIYPPLLLLFSLLIFIVFIFHSNYCAQKAFRYLLFRHGIALSQVKSFKGNLASGIVIDNVILRGYMGPFDLSKVVIGQMRVRLTFPLNFELVINNGQLLQNVSEPIIFYGRVTNNNCDITLYSQAIIASRLFGTFFKNVEFVQKLEGRAINIDGLISGPLESPTVQAKFMIEKISYHDFTARDVPAELNFSFLPRHKAFGLYGGLFFNGGIISSAQSAPIYLKQHSRLYFIGEPNRPFYDFKAYAKVGKVTIDIGLIGERNKPVITLLSEPNLSQAQLLALILTNRTWDAAGDTLANGGISSNLAAEVIDYFVFGNSGQRLLGNMGFNLAAEVKGKERGVSIKQSIGDISVEAARIYTDPSSANSSTKQEDRFEVKYLKEF